jgi:tetratricopeptide (TPR) repeat protein
LDYYQRSLLIQRQVDPAGARRTLYRIGKIYDGLEDFEKALDVYQQATVIPQQQGNVSQESTACADRA